MNYITTHAPAPNGVLKRKLNYVFSFRDFEELRQEKLCIPDGIIINENKRLLIIPECKSGVSQDKDAEPRIHHQVTVYCSKRFHEILSKLVDYDGYEIVVFTFSQAVEPMIEELKGLKTADANIVIWSLERETSKDEVIIKKVYGKHIDAELNRVMSLGVTCEPPAREFIDPDMPEPRIAFVIGCRLLNAFGERLLKNDMAVMPSEFRKGNLDLVFSENRLRHFFRAISRLIPELCKYDRKSGNIEFKRRLDHEVVHRRLDQISKMTNEQYRKTLGLPVSEEPYRKIEQKIEQVLKPKRTPTLEEIMWQEKT